MQIKRTSVISGIERTRDIPVNPEDLLTWEMGFGSIQSVMSYLNDADREFILSGIVPSEWADAFNDDDVMQPGHEELLKDDL